MVGYFIFMYVRGFADCSGVLHQVIKCAHMASFDDCFILIAASLICGVLVSVTTVAYE